MTQTPKWTGSTIDLTCPTKVAPLGQNFRNVTGATSSHGIGLYNDPPINTGDFAVINSTDLTSAKFSSVLDGGFDTYNDPFGLSFVIHRNAKTFPISDQRVGTIKIGSYESIYIDYIASERALKISMASIVDDLKGFVKLRLAEFDTFDYDSGDGYISASSEPITGMLMINYIHHRLNDSTSLKNNFIALYDKEVTLDKPDWTRTLQKMQISVFRGNPPLRDNTTNSIVKNVLKNTLWTRLEDSKTASSDMFKGSVGKYITYIQLTQSIGWFQSVGLFRLPLSGKAITKDKLTANITTVEDILSTGYLSMPDTTGRLFIPITDSSMSITYNLGDLSKVNLWKHPSFIKTTYAICSVYNPLSAWNQYAQVITPSYRLGSKGVGTPTVNYNAGKFLTETNTGSVPSGIGYPPVYPIPLSPIMSPTLGLTNSGNTQPELSKLLAFNSTLSNNLLDYHLDVEMLERTPAQRRKLFQPDEETVITQATLAEFGISDISSSSDYEYAGNPYVLVNLVGVSNWAFNGATIYKYTQTIHPERLPSMFGGMKGRIFEDLMRYRLLRYQTLKSNLAPHIQNRLVKSYGITAVDGNDLVFKFSAGSIMNQLGTVSSPSSLEEHFNNLGPNCIAMEGRYVQSQNKVLVDTFTDVFTTQHKLINGLITQPATSIYSGSFLHKFNEVPISVTIKPREVSSSNWNPTITISQGVSTSGTKTLIAVFQLDTDFSPIREEVILGSRYDSTFYVGFTFNNTLNANDKFVTVFNWLIYTGIEKVGSKTYTDVFKGTTRGLSQDWIIASSVNTNETKWNYSVFSPYYLVSMTNATLPTNWLRVSNSKSPIYTTTNATPETLPLYLVFQSNNMSAYQQQRDMDNVEVTSTTRYAELDEAVDTTYLAYKTEMNKSFEDAITELKEAVTSIQQQAQAKLAEATAKAAEYATKTRELEASKTELSDLESKVIALKEESETAIAVLENNQMDALNDINDVAFWQGLKNIPIIALDLESTEAIQSSSTLEIKSIDKASASKLVITPNTTVSQQSLTINTAVNSYGQLYQNVSKSMVMQNVKADDGFTLVFKVTIGTASTNQWFPIWTSHNYNLKLTTGKDMLVVGYNPSKGAIGVFNTPPSVKEDPAGILALTDESYLVTSLVITTKTNFVTYVSVSVNKTAGNLMATQIFSTDYDGMPKIQQLTNIAILNPALPTSTSLGLWEYHDIPTAFSITSQFFKIQQMFIFGADVSISTIRQLLGTRVNNELRVGWDMDTISARLNGDNE